MSFVLLVNIVSVNGLVSDGTKPLPEPILIHHGPHYHHFQSYRTDNKSSLHAVTLRDPISKGRACGIVRGLQTPVWDSRMSVFIRELSDVCMGLLIGHIQGLNVVWSYCVHQLHCMNYIEFLHVIYVEKEIGNSVWIEFIFHGMQFAVTWYRYWILS